MSKRKRKEMDGVERVYCRAHTRDGTLCKNPPMQGGAVCRMHGGATKAARAKAVERIAAAADPAARKLVELMKSKKVPYNVQLAAARDLLDRAGIGNKHEVSVEIKRWEEGLDRIFVDFSDTGQRDIVEAEVIEDERRKPYRTTLPTLSKDDPEPPKYGAGRRDG